MGDIENNQKKLENILQQADEAVRNSSHVRDTHQRVLSYPVIEIATRGIYDPKERERVRQFLIQAMIDSNT